MTQDKAQSSHVAPRSDVERRIAQIWQDTLGVESISIRDNFFDVGGSSIQAYQILADIARDLGTNLSANSLLEAPTIEQQAALIEGRDLEDEGSLVPFRVEGSKPPWFCVHGVGGGVIFLQQLLPHLDTEWPVYGIQPAPTEDGLPDFRTVEAIASEYVAEMRQVQPNGPYYLGGSCFGGQVAREMARILHHESGEEVALLVCIDPPWRTSDESASSRLSDWLRAQALKVLGRRTREESREYREHQVKSKGRDRFVHYSRIHRKAAREYQPGPSDVPMVIIGARWTTKRHMRMWASVTPSGVEVLEVPVPHADLFLPPNAPTVAAYIQQALDEADRRQLGS